jgi:hypothetical protein
LRKKNKLDKGCVARRESQQGCCCNSWVICQTTINYYTICGIGWIKGHHLQRIHWGTSLRSGTGILGKTLKTKLSETIYQISIKTIYQICLITNLKKTRFTQHIYLTSGGYRCFCTQPTWSSSSGLWLNFGDEGSLGAGT